jgi:hypothetical protein
VTLFAKVTFDVSGVPTLVTSETILGPQNPTSINPSSGFASVEKVGGNFYKFHLQDPYVRLLGVSATGVALATDFSNVAVGTVTATETSNTDPFVLVAFLDYTNPPGPLPIDGSAPGSFVLVTMTFANSTAL